MLKHPLIHIPPCFPKPFTNQNQTTFPFHHTNIVTREALRIETLKRSFVEKSECRPPANSLPVTIPSSHACMQRSANTKLPNQEDKIEIPTQVIVPQEVILISRKKKKPNLDIDKIERSIGSK